MLQNWWNFSQFEMLLSHKCKCRNHNTSYRYFALNAVLFIIMSKVWDFFPTWFIWLFTTCTEYIYLNQLIFHYHVIFIDSGLWPDQDDIIVKVKLSSEFTGSRRYMHTDWPLYNRNNQSCSSSCNTTCHVTYWLFDGTTLYREPAETSLNHAGYHQQTIVTQLTATS